MRRLAFMTCTLTCLLLGNASRAEGEGQGQPGDGAAATEVKADGDPGEKPGTSEELRVTDEITIPPAQMQTEAKTAIDEMRAAVQRSIEMLTKARETKDIIRLNCVNERLTPMKGILKIAEDANIGLQENLANNNIEAARNEFVKIRIAKEKISVLLAQIINCVGSDSAYSGDTENSLDIDKDMAGGDPYYGDPHILVDPANKTVQKDPNDSKVGEDNPDIRPPVVSPYR